MILTAMQPYFFPYVGYFQLLECSDIFVVLDDVQYINRGWVNRNRILINQEPYWLTFAVQKASQNLAINQRYYVEDQNVRNKILNNIKYAYKKAPQFKAVFPFIEEIMKFDSINVSEFNTNSIRRLARLLGIECQILLSSELKKDSSIKGQERIIEINRSLGSSHYVNPIGGIALYQEDSFFDFGIELSFIRSDDIKYDQRSGSFIPSLSIIDVLMFCPLDEVRMHMKQYKLLKHSDMV